jgi:hypothetical protein
MEREGSGIVVRSGGSIVVSACFRVPGGKGSSGTGRQNGNMYYWRDSAGVHPVPKRLLSDVLIDAVP